jgi:hypothetical protein
MPVYVGLFLIRLPTLAMQVALTGRLSVVTWDHLAFLVLLPRHSGNDGWVPSSVDANLMSTRRLSLPAGLSAGAWTRESIKRVFGMTTLAVEQPPPAPVEHPVDPAREATEGRRVVRMAAPEPPTGARLVGQPDPSAASRLVDSYAQASEALGHAVEDVREQRDEARRFLDDLRPRDR